MRRGTADDYPYDPEAKVGELIGLERLRAVRHRGMAGLLYELYWVAERNDSRTQRLHEAEERRREDDDWEHLQSMTQKALDGVYGAESKRVADEYLRGRNRLRPTLEELRRLLQRVPGRVSG